VSFSFGNIQISVPLAAAVNPALTAEAVRKGLADAVNDLAGRLPSEFVV